MPLSDAPCTFKKSATKRREAVMQILEGYQALASLPGLPSAVGIGVFDGVHLGHQALLKQVMALSRATKLRAIAFTFAPHPARLFAPDKAPQLIEPLAYRLERLAALGIDCTVVQPFDRAFANLSPQSFIDIILHQYAQARHVVVGAGFVFGHKQQGHVGVLREAGRKAHFKVHPVPHVAIAGLEVSSTKIRDFVRQGAVDKAAALLGRAFVLTGEVVQGAGRGTALGMPTANLAPDNELSPKSGVYAATAMGTFGQAPCVVNIGTNPTFESGRAIKIEAHLFDYAGPNFYATQMRLHLRSYIRAERKFGSAVQLKAQITQDVTEARRLIRQA